MVFSSRPWENQEYVKLGSFGNKDLNNSMYEKCTVSKLEMDKFRYHSKVAICINMQFTGIYQLIAHLRVQMIVNVLYLIFTPIRTIYLNIIYFKILYLREESHDVDAPKLNTLNSPP